MYMLYGDLFMTFEERNSNDICQNCVYYISSTSSCKHKHMNYTNVVSSDWCPFYQVERRIKHRK